MKLIPIEPFLGVAVKMSTNLRQGQAVPTKIDELLAFYGRSLDLDQDVTASLHTSLFPLKQAFLQYPDTGVSGALKQCLDEATPTSGDRCGTIRALQAFCMRVVADRSIQGTGEASIARNHPPDLPDG